MYLCMTLYQKKNWNKSTSSSESMWVNLSFFRRHHYLHKAWQLECTLDSALRRFPVMFHQNYLGLFINVSFCWAWYFWVLLCLTFTGLHNFTQRISKSPLNKQAPRVLLNSILPFTEFPRWSWESNFWFSCYKKGCITFRLPLPENWYWHLSRGRKYAAITREPHQLETHGEAHKKAACLLTRFPP